MHEKGQIVLVGDHMQLRPHVTNRTASHAGLDTSLKTSVASVWGVRALPRIARQTLEDVVGIVPTTVLSADCLDTHMSNKTNPNGNVSCRKLYGGRKYVRARVEFG